ncbi:TetR/AcrR family transcriptional regulator [Nocardioides salsibiostraticola]
MPRIVDTTERRAEVASAARSVIAREGLEGTTIRKVAAEAGSSTTVVTHYFRDKDALIAAAVQDAYAAVESRMAQLSRGFENVNTSVIDRLRVMLLEALPLDGVRREEARVWMAFWAAASARPELRTVQRDGYRSWRALIRAVLDEAALAGELRQDLDTDAELDLLLCLVDGVLMQATLEPRRYPAARQQQLLESALARLAVGADS